jgi:hypothetical protein
VSWCQIYTLPSNHSIKSVKRIGSNSAQHAFASTCNKSGVDTAKAGPNDVTTLLNSSEFPEPLASDEITQAYLLRITPDV